MQLPHQPSRPGRLSAISLDALSVVGERRLLAHRRIAVFCSSTCPGSAILAAMHRFESACDAGCVYIGGFHTDVEKMCLGILLRRCQPAIVFPARSLVRMRIPEEWRQAIAEGRLAIASPFCGRNHRPTRGNCLLRNEVVAALADRIVVVACDPASQLRNQILSWQASGTDTEILVA